MKASCVALKASFQHLCDLLKKRREKLPENNNDQEQEPKLKLQQSTKGGGSVEAQLPLVASAEKTESGKENNLSLNSQSLEFNNKKYESLQLSASSPPPSPPAPPPKPPDEVVAPFPLPPKPPEKVLTSVFKATITAQVSATPLPFPPSEPPDKISAPFPSPAPLPPSKPLDAPSVFLIFQSCRRTPLCLSRLLLINLLSRPPENVSSLIPASPPPPKPPDIQSSPRKQMTSFTITPMRPPPRPPDLKPSCSFYHTPICLPFTFFSTEKMENSTIDPCDRVVLLLHVQFGTISQLFVYLILI
ncbi:hypothetical protein QL285_059639 [Trifolium repens]|nr:hypothetical protein QL285_059639 [Trifolium repens]